MDSAYEHMFKTPVRFRIIEKRTGILESFISTRGLSPLLSIECKPLRDCEPKRCFKNVEMQVAKAGGRMLTGWIFNEFEKRYIQGEAHAVWISPIGKRLDITPHEFQPKRVLFSPDEVVAVKRGFTAPPKLMLSDDPKLVSIERFDSILDKLFEEAFEGFGKYIEIAPEKLEEAERESGLPHDVAAHILRQRVAYRKEAAERYATRDNLR